MLFWISSFVDILQCHNLRPSRVMYMGLCWLFCWLLRSSLFFNTTLLVTAKEQCLFPLVGINVLISFAWIVSCSVCSMIRNIHLTDHTSAASVFFLVSSFTFHGSLPYNRIRSIYHFSSLFLMCSFTFQNLLNTIGQTRYIILVLSFWCVRSRSKSQCHAIEQSRCIISALSFWHSVKVLYYIRYFSTFKILLNCIPENAVFASSYQSRIVHLMLWLPLNVWLVMMLYYALIWPLFLFSWYSFSHFLW